MATLKGRNFRDEAQQLGLGSAKQSRHELADAAVAWVGGILDSDWQTYEGREYRRHELDFFLINEAGICPARISTVIEGHKGADKILDAFQVKGSGRNRNGKLRRSAEEIWGYWTSLEDPTDPESRPRLNRGIAADTMQAWLSEGPFAKKHGHGLFAEEQFNVHQKSTKAREAQRRKQLRSERWEIRTSCQLNSLPIAQQEADLLLKYLRDHPDVAKAFADRLSAAK